MAIFLNFKPFNKWFLKSLKIFNQKINKKNILIK